MPSVIEIPHARSSGAWSIQVPDFPRSDLFVLTAPRVIQSALKECHPFVRRRRATVGFLPEVVSNDDETGKTVEVLGHSIIETKERKMEFSLREIERILDRRPEVGWHLQVGRLILHELFEEDYHIRSFRYGRSEHRNVGDPDYSKAEHEVIADKRALRQLSLVMGVNYQFDRDGLIFIPNPIYRLHGIMQF